MTSQPAPSTSPAHSPRCLAIVPAFNESGAIAAVVADLRTHAPQVDILVIDDGSTDGTAACVPPPATVIRLPFNLGIGGAMQTGYRYAREHGYDVALQVDGDGQHPADQIPALIAALRETGADLIVGSRFLNAGSYQQSPARMAGIRVLIGLLRLLTGKPLTDPTSGFRAANRRVIEAFAAWYPDDYPEPEVLVLLSRVGYVVREIPVRMAPRRTGRSSIGLLTGVFYVLKVSAALLLSTLRRPWSHLAESPP
jgi:glycosyltransferase involved in cell wall biosynthesis